jgi:hypothetical protein
VILAANTKFLYLNYLTPNRPEFDMALRKSQRSRRATVAFKDKVAYPTASSLKLTAKIAQNNPKTALEPIPIKPLPEIDH